MKNDLKYNEAIILAGGFGTRLKEVLKGEIPKPLADINGKPFLEHLLLKLEKEGIKKVTLCVCHKKEMIMDYFKDKFNSINIKYSQEDEPLGTGGAIFLASKTCHLEKFFVLNGDSFFDLSLKEMQDDFDDEFDISIAIKKMTNFSRYGNIIFDKNKKIQDFKEKEYTKIGFINTGVYLFKKEIFSNFDLKENFSIEKDFFEKFSKEGSLKIRAFQSESYFIDIGIKEDYERFKKYKREHL